TCGRPGPSLVTATSRAAYCHPCWAAAELVPDLRGQPGYHDTAAPVESESVGVLAQPSVAGPTGHGEMRGSGRAPGGRYHEPLARLGHHRYVVPARIGGAARRLSVLVG